MPVQLPLPAMGDARRPSRPRFNIFFALVPERSAALDLAQRGALLQQQWGIRGKPLPAHRLHVTLHRVGGYMTVPAEVVSAALRSGDAVHSPGIDVVFDRVVVFDGAGAFVLLVGQGRQPMEAVRRALGTMSEGPVGVSSPSAFTPHMTLAYGKQQLGEQAIEPIRWRASELALINSHVGQSHHEVLGRWHLGI